MAKKYMHTLRCMHGKKYYILRALKKICLLFFFSFFLSKDLSSLNFLHTLRNRIEHELLSSSGMKTHFMSKVAPNLVVKDSVYVKVEAIVSNVLDNIHCAKE